MAYKQIDTFEDEVFEGWSYVDKDHDEIFVGVPRLCNGGMVSDIGIVGMGEHVFSMFVKDIPKLIKALEAAYNYKE